jgi:NDP-sugar pyrophosphorylase family protein
LSSDAIILCGGAASRLKPYLPFNKALAEISPSITLLEYQIGWLKENGIHGITLAIDEDSLRSVKETRKNILDEVSCSVEKERLGTGGAVRQALDYVKTDSFYLMNVDDILLSNDYIPQDLLNIHKKDLKAAGSILLAKTRFPFGVVETSGNLVVKFKQKPKLDLMICAGHYTFTKKTVEEYFPLKGGFESEILPRIAHDLLLYSHEFNGEWVTINNLKQLTEAIQILSRIHR